MSPQARAFLLISEALLAGLSATSLFWIVREFLGDATLRVEVANRHDQKRRLALKQKSRCYRRCYPVIVTIDSMMGERFQEFENRIRKLLVKSGNRLWTPGEYLAGMILKAVAFASVAFVFFVTLYGATLFVSAVLCVAGFAASIGFQYRVLTREARKRLDTISIRLPYAVDLISLILDSGGQFYDAVGFVLKEMDSHPLADEFEQMQSSIRRGTPRHEAMNDLRDRLELPIVNELVSNMIQGEISGTPLTAIFRNMAEQMRSKRYQMLEAAIAKAGVQMSYPGIICMVSSMMIVLSVFLIPMSRSGIFDLFNN